MKLRLWILSLITLYSHYSSSQQTRTYDIQEALNESNPNSVEEIYMLNTVGDIPDSIFKYLGLFKNLKSLRIQNNFKSIPEEVFKIKGLRELRVNDNKLVSVPKNIEELTELKVLDLSNNEFTEIPAVVFTLASLEHLDVSINHIEQIPANIQKLQKLEYLHIEANLIHTIPLEIDFLPNLTYLGISANKGISLPNTLSRLESLTRINASECNWTSIPDVIYNIRNLEELDLAWNKLTTVDVVRFAKLKQLNRIILNRNPISETEAKRIKNFLPGKMISFSEDGKLLTEEIMFCQKYFGLSPTERIAFFRSQMEGSTSELYVKKFFIVTRDLGSMTGINIGDSKVFGIGGVVNFPFIENDTTYKKLVDSLTQALQKNFFLKTSLLHTRTKNDTTEYNILRSYLKNSPKNRVAFIEVNFTTIPQRLQSLFKTDLDKIYGINTLSFLDDKKAFMKAKKKWLTFKK